MIILDFTPEAAIAVVVMMVVVVTTTAWPRMTSTSRQATTPQGIRIVGFIVTVRIIRIGIRVGLLGKTVFKHFFVLQGETIKFDQPFRIRIGGLRQETS